MSTDPLSAQAPSAWAPTTSAATAAAPAHAPASWALPVAPLSSARWRLRAEGAALGVIVVAAVETARAMLPTGDRGDQATAAPVAEVAGLSASQPEAAPPELAPPAPPPSAAPRSTAARVKHRAPSTALVVEAGGPCAWTAKVPGGMSALTDDGLAAAQLRGRSPLTLTLDGAQVPRRAAGAPCADGFSMSARALSWAGPSAAAAVTLDPAFPVMTSAGPTWWVYSGSAVAVQTPLAAGDTVQLEATGVGGKPAHRAELVIGGQRVPLELKAGQVQVTVTVAAPTEALQVEIPHGGPHLALTALHRSRGGALDDLLVVR